MFTIKTYTFFLLSIIAISFSSCSFQKPNNKNNNSSSNKKTQAYLGVKQGGEWKLVSHANGNDFREYQGGEFKPVSQFRVPDEHTINSLYLQFEGPGWESDKIAYRIYLDSRNAIDIFGKKTDTTVLHNVGSDGFGSYHDISEWGVDVLKVGSSMGMGSVGFWTGNKAVHVEKTDSILCKLENNSDNSSVTIDYFGWDVNNMKVNLQSVMQIEAGSYLTKYTQNLSTSLPNLVTGIVKQDNTAVKVFTDIKEGWTCLATFGTQTLQNDKLGMCVFVKTDQLTKITSDENSELLVMKPINNTLTYYFGAAWEQDSSKVTSIEEFKKLLLTQAKYIH